MDISGTRGHHLMLVVSARTPLLRETTAPHCHADGWSVAGDWTTNCSWRGGGRPGHPKRNGAQVGLNIGDIIHGKSMVTIYLDYLWDINCGI